MYARRKGRGRSLAPLPRHTAEANGGIDPATGTAFAEERIARERRLRRAVLIDAIRCIGGVGVRVHRKSGQQRREALIWLRAPDASLPFSFLYVCDSLGLDPSSVRREVLTRYADLDFGSSARNRITNLVREPRGVCGRYLAAGGQ